ncbi:hypothetical protein [Streptomyces sp. NRRL S-337]|uniref:hypothetical protein n=1 Tax=Streptomyces sp. NRRL S-337 TaxID=1463900 RepID=UPI0004C69935|nr:hypothetical protein [Streptomyces sp. NRRL S-337]
MKSSRIFTSGAAVLASTAVLLTLGQSSATAAGVKAAGAPVPWKATYGTATASGTRSVEPKDGSVYSKLVIKGDFKNTGNDCYSVWTQWTYDLVPRPPVKQATLCGKGSKSVDLSLASYTFTTTGSVFICRGDKDTKDCGEQESLTSWPVNHAR